MGEEAAADASEERKKKGRPSLADLQKRSLGLPQKLQGRQNVPPHSSPNLKERPPPPTLSSKNPTRRSTCRSPKPAGILPAPGVIAGAYYDDEDDERKEKKLKLVEKLPPSLPDDRRLPRSSADSSFSDSGCFASDSNADVANNRPLKKTRRINAVSDRFRDGFANKGEKVSKATDGPLGCGSSLVSGPTMPLPDKKLMVFILDRLQKKDVYGVFSEPVDPKELPDYRSVIERPMDFGTMRKKLEGGGYSVLEQFEEDLFLICSNAMQYNSPGTVYFRQARSIKELAKKDFEALRQYSDENASKPKVPRRGRPPKCLNKSTSYSQWLLATTQCSSEDKKLDKNLYNLMQGPTPCQNPPADVPARSSQRPPWSIELNNDFSVDSVMKGTSRRHGKKQSTVDSIRRDTYRQYFAPDAGYGSGVMTAFDGGKQLLEVGLHAENGYARSLASFAADLGPVVWKIASKKILSVLPAGVQFSPGWMKEEEPRQPPSILHETLKASSDITDHGHYSSSSLLLPHSTDVPTLDGIENPGTVSEIQQNSRCPLEAACCVLPQAIGLEHGGRFWCPGEPSYKEVPLDLNLRFQLPDTPDST